MRDSASIGNCCWVKVSEGLGQKLQHPQLVFDINVILDLWLERQPEDQLQMLGERLTIPGDRTLSIKQLFNTRG